MSRRTLIISVTALLGLTLVGAHLLTREDVLIVPENPSPVVAARPAASASPARRTPATDARPAPLVSSTAASTLTPATTSSAMTNPAPVVVASVADVARARQHDSRPRDELPTPYEFSKEGLRGAIEEKMPEIRECYEAWKKQNPGLAGRLLVGFDIAADNRGAAEVQHIELVDGGVGQPFMEGCVLNAFQDIRFEEPPGGGQVKVRYPIELGPAGGGVDAGAR